MSKGKRHLKKILVIDLEATCWEGGVAPEGQMQEIIEIGVTPMEAVSWVIGPSESIYVLPRESTISPYCTQLTGITEDLLSSQGVSFEKACKILVRGYGSRNATWVSWGDSDRTCFQKQCTRRGVEYPFGANHINLKTLFSLALGETRAYGMARALEHIGMSLDGKHHTGKDDSYNTAKILAWVMNGFRALKGEINNEAVREETIS